MTGLLFKINHVVHITQLSQQPTWGIDPVLVWCWASVVDDGLILVRHWVNTSCLLGCCNLVTPARFVNLQNYIMSTFYILHSRVDANYRPIIPDLCMHIRMMVSTLVYINIFVASEKRPIFKSWLRVEHLLCLLEQNDASVYLFEIKHVSI